MLSFVMPSPYIPSNPELKTFFFPVIEFLRAKSKQSVLWGYIDGTIIHTQENIAEPCFYIFFSVSELKEFWGQFNKTSTSVIYK